MSGKTYWSETPDLSLYSQEYVWQFSGTIIPNVSISEQLPQLHKCTPKHKVKPRVKFEVRHCFFCFYYSSILFFARKLILPTTHWNARLLMFLVPICVLSYSVWIFLPAFWKNVPIVWSWSKNLQNLVIILA
jgi:hypothetical protein